MYGSYQFRIQNLGLFVLHSFLLLLICYWLFVIGHQSLVISHWFTKDKGQKTKDIYTIKASSSSLSSTGAPLALAFSAGLR
ncbi:hypothetical protein FRE64_13310 [Euhalothece natronophila Z-M001]|uniref:Uncharacterized protein n=1 Tax=Euhalothece natronophila Z-M001 TaxID=522448 RepID=A0A5B8NP41_9CHRO|nr:hypothetical protein FRE64_13310 [Euhalothece natronophila Z-M001]